MAKRTIPNDVIPFEGGTVIVTEVLPDGSNGKVASTFSNFLISVTPSTSREEEKLEVGYGTDIPFPQSETQTWEIVVNAYNAEFDALLTSRDFEYGSAVVPDVASVVIGSDSTYTFAGESLPVENEDGIFIKSVVDSDGNTLQDASGSTETLTYGYYQYDSDDGELTVTSEYVGDTLTVTYFKTATEVATTKAAEILESKEFMIEALSLVQSAKGKQKLRRYLVVDRVVFTGDVPSIPNQKSINTNMSYTVASQEPRAGKRRFTDQIYNV